LVDEHSVVGIENCFVLAVVPSPVVVADLALAVQGFEKANSVEPESCLEFGLGPEVESPER
jgi:hypothetical protein